MSKLVYKAILHVQSEIHAVGIGKLRRNKEQGFNFRGIDDALMAFAPLLTQSKLILVPSYSQKVVKARKTKSGGSTYNVSVSGTFTFIHAEDGSDHTVGPFYGEANDGQDKAVSKATSIAMRNMFFVTFVVPHEPAIGGDPDGVSEAESEYDCSAWLSKIQAATDMDELASIADELKDARVPDAALKVIRRHWGIRTKAIKKGGAA